MSVMSEKKDKTVEKKDETVEKKDETVEKKDENSKIEEGGETSDDEAVKPKKVRVRIQRKPRFSPSIWNFYKIEENKIQQSHDMCPKCGPGYFLAQHSNRLTCGKCHYTKFNNS